MSNHTKTQGAHLSYRRGVCTVSLYDNDGLRVHVGQVGQDAGYSVRHDVGQLSILVVKVTVTGDIEPEAEGR